MKLLRDVREGTRLLLLLEITTGRHTRMKGLAERLGLSVQGVSGYLGAMTQEGLVHRVDGVYTATMAGVETLHDRLRELKEFVEQSYAKTQLVDRTTAMAGGTTEAGEEVGLFMEDGRLVAYPGRASASRGRALGSAAAGEDVTVVELEGIVELEPGRITVLRIPGAAQGGTAAIDLDEARRIVEAQGAGKVAVSDLVARVLTNKLDIAPDFEFAPVSASLEAAHRGLDVLLIASEESASDVIARLEAANEGSEKPVAYEVISLAPEEGG